ncbi:MAG: bifunctional oligoribonuclease/PAP phosphatase NrnA, partial [Microcystis aeruginosa Ma_AC_P_19900807_S299]
MMAELLSLVPAKSLETDVVAGEAPAVCPLPPVTVSNDTLLISLIDRLRRTL